MVGPNKDIEAARARMVTRAWRATGLQEEACSRSEGGPGGSRHQAAGRRHRKPGGRQRHPPAPGAAGYGRAFGCPARRGRRRRRQPHADARDFLGRRETVVARPATAAQAVRRSHQSRVRYQATTIGRTRDRREEGTVGKSRPSKALIGAFEPPAIFRQFSARGRPRRCRARPVAMQLRIRRAPHRPRSRISFEQFPLSALGSALV